MRYSAVSKIQPLLCHCFLTARNVEANFLQHCRQHETYCNVCHVFFACWLTFFICSFHAVDKRDKSLAAKAHVNIFEM